MAYTRVRGSSRYVNTDTGETISRRAHEDIKAREIGLRDYRQFQNRKKDPLYRTIASAAPAEKRVRMTDSPVRAWAGLVNADRSTSYNSAKRPDSESVRAAKRRLAEYLGNNDNPAWNAAWQTFYSREEVEGTPSESDFLE